MCMISSQQNMFVNKVNKLIRRTSWLDDGGGDDDGAIWCVHFVPVCLYIQSNIYGTLRWNVTWSRSYNVHQNLTLKLLLSGITYTVLLHLGGSKSSNICMLLYKIFMKNIETNITLKTQYEADTSKTVATTSEMLELILPHAPGRFSTLRPLHSQISIT